MRCGRPEHQQGEKCAARNAKCKDCHKIGHFYKVCQSSKRTRRANLAQVTPQDEDDTHIDKCGYTQPNPPVVNMLKVTNHTGTTSGTQFLKFPIDVNPRGSYKHHLEVSIDTGADVNCMNEKTFKKLFPEVELSVCPHNIQNFGNSTADVYILGQFRTYLQFRGRKYLNTFIVTNANDCPNILSHGAIFRMGILVSNYPEENMVKLGDMETGTSNVFQVLQDLQMKQYQGNSEPKAHQPSTTFTTSTIKPNGKVVCYASRALTKTEQNYQNLEREALGTIWGMEKFHYFLYGKEFTLETDQKPLVSIYKKHMVDISPRVQRLIVRSFPYQPFTVVYKKGRDIPVADALSHMTPMDPEDNIKLPIIAVNMITKLVLTSTFTQDNFSRKLDRIRKSTLQDNQLTRLSRYINTGFPCEKKNLPRDLQDYWNCQDMLSIENGLVTCGSRIIVPHEMRAEMLQYIHEGHQGKERCLL